MEALYDSGLVRAIGVSNFSSKKLGDLLDVARVRPAVNQVECHPSWQQPKIHAYCRSKGVHLSVSMIDDTNIDCGTGIMSKKIISFICNKGDYISYFDFHFSFQGYMPLARTRVFNNPVLTSLAEKLGKTPAQVALRWGLQMGHSILPKSSSEATIKENFDVFDWSIPEDLLARFSEIEQVSCFLLFFILLVMVSRCIKIFVKLSYDPLIVDFVLCVFELINSW